MDPSPGSQSSSASTTTITRFNVESICRTRFLIRSLSFDRDGSCLSAVSHWLLIEARCLSSDRTHLTRSSRAPMPPSSEERDESWFSPSIPTIADCPLRSVLISLSHEFPSMSLPLSTFIQSFVQQLTAKMWPACGPGLSRPPCYRRDRRFRSHPQPDGSARLR